ncbi:MAG: hypothetical protein V1760_00640, partial [Candidatus Peregrinibacteria bacterium]
MTNPNHPHDGQEHAEIPQELREQVEAALHYKDSPSAWRLATLGGLTLAALAGIALQARAPIEEAINRHRFGNSLRVFKPDVRSPQEVQSLKKEAAGHKVCINGGNMTFDEQT